MKKCQKCGKPAEELTIALTHGPNGFRRYSVCPKCARTSIQPAPATPIKKEKKRVRKAQ